MKSIICQVLLTATLLLFTTFVFGQSPSKTNTILKTVTSINSDGSLTTKTLSTEQFLSNKPGETGQLTGYFKNGQLVKMNVRLGLPSCVKTEKYYFSNDSLIMYYLQERAFLYNETTKTYDVAHQTTAMEGWYFYEGTALLKMDFKGEPKCTEKPSEQQAAEVLTTGKKYAASLKK